MDVHSRDVVTALYEKQISQPTNFQWLAQLRYYWIVSRYKDKK